MTTYTGICKFLLNGEIINIRVRDPYGNELFISVEDYISRNVKPDISLLPECKQ
jgi:hypothetical protein